MQSTTANLVCGCNLFFGAYGDFVTSLNGGILPGDRLSNGSRGCECRFLGLTVVFTLARLKNKLVNDDLASSVNVVNSTLEIVSAVLVGSYVLDILDNLLL